MKSAMCAVALVFCLFSNANAQMPGFPGFGNPQQVQALTEQVKVEDEMFRIQVAVQFDNLFAVSVSSDISNATVIINGMTDAAKKAAANVKLSECKAELAKLDIMMTSDPLINQQMRYASTITAYRATKTSIAAANWPAVPARQAAFWTEAALFNVSREQVTRQLSKTLAAHGALRLAIK